MQSLQPALHPFSSPRRRPSSSRAPPARAALPDSAPPSSASAPSPPPPSPPPPQEQSGNGKVVAAGAAAFGAALFLLSRSAVAPSFAALEAESVPFEQARLNGRPTVLEFYADWCEVRIRGSDSASPAPAHLRASRCVERACPAWWTWRGCRPAK